MAAEGSYYIFKCVDMANRILRDWTDSEKINSLSVQAERFFVRLIMKVDDYGCFPSDTRLLKANLFPLLLDTVREADISRWIAECKKAGLIVLYEANGKGYMQINEFRQRLDRAKHKYPLPSANESVAIVTDFPPETESETKQNPKLESESKHFVRENVSLFFSELEKLKTEFSQQELDWMLDLLSNYKLSSGRKYKSDYGAIRTWVIKRLEEEKEKNSAKKEKDGGARQTTTEQRRAEITEVKRRAIQTLLNAQNRDGGNQQPEPEPGKDPERTG